MCYSLWFWILLWLLLELAGSDTAATSLTLAFSAISLVAFSLLWTGFDLLAFFIFAAYSSVFVLLSFFLLFLGSIALTAVQPSRVQLGFFTPITFFLGIFVSSSLHLDSASTFLNSISGLRSLGWINLLEDATYFFNLTTGLLHWFFYKLFVFETFWLNLYLFLGVVIAVSLLFLLRLWSNFSIEASLLSGHAHRRGFAYPTNARIHLTASFRRQTRRKNSSLQSHSFIR